MNGSQYIAHFLAGMGVRHVFELSGGMITHLLDEIFQIGKLEIINVYHEQAAAFAADAIGRLSGAPGVAIATSGPGAINLLTGVSSAYFDSSPALFITGQVNRHEQKQDKPIRQLGFQETDIVSMAKPITKWAERVHRAEDIPAAFEQAWRIAIDGRPGAVLLDIPMDVFRSELSDAQVHKSLQRFMAPTPSSAPSATIAGQHRPHSGTSPGGTLSNSSHTPRGDLQSAEVEPLQDALSRAQRPLLLAGGGVRAARAHARFVSFVDQMGIPVVHSLLASDCLPFEHPLRIGMIGTYGNRWANLALAESDLLLVLGSRLDIRQTGADTKSFGLGRQIFHVDVEEAEINNRLEGCHGIHTDLQDFFRVTEHWSKRFDRQDWRARIHSLREAWPDTSELQDCSGINPNVLMHVLSQQITPAAYCVDVGLHQMWAAQSLELRSDTRFLTSGGLGAMGFALPAAIGAAFFHGRQRPIVVIAGDGGFQINIQELQNVVHHRLPLKMVVLNNDCHGMTRQFQDTYYGSRYVGTKWGYSPPHFEKIATAYGIPARRLSNPEEAQDAIAWLCRDPLEASLLEVSISPTTNAYPKLAFGRPISEMEPFSKPISMEGT